MNCRNKVLVLAVLFVGCAKHSIMTTSKMPSDVGTFKGLAYIIAETGKAKMANNVSVIVKQPDGLRLDAIERITDVVASLKAKGGNGYLDLPLKGKRYTFKNDMIRFPEIGDVQIPAVELASVLVGRPIVHEMADVEIDRGEGFITFYTRYESSDKKRVLYEAHFGEMARIGGKKFPRHVIVRFEHPKLMIDVRYKDVQHGINIPWGLFE